MVENDALNKSGLVCSRMCDFLKEKCVWDLRQALEWTGWVTDLAEFQISISERRVNACVEAISVVLVNRGWTTTRKLA